MFKELHMGENRDLDGTGRLFGFSTDLLQEKTLQTRDVFWGDDFRL